MTNWMPDLTQLPIAATLLAKLTVLLAAAWLLHALLSARNPRRRVLLWRLALGGVLLLLAGEAVLPRLSVAVPASWMAPGGGRDLRANPALAQSDERTRPATGGGPATALARAAAAGGAPALAAATPGRRLGLGSLAASAEESASAVARWLAQRPSRWLMALWGAGALMLAVRLAASYRRLRRLVRSARPAPESAGALLGQMAEAMGLNARLNARPGNDRMRVAQPPSAVNPSTVDLQNSRGFTAEGGCATRIGRFLGRAKAVLNHSPALTPRLRVADGLASPFVTGWLRPTIVLPAAMVEERHRALLPGIFAHELAHLAAGDLGWMLLARWAGVALWFHPLAWGMRRAHDAACEEVCDGVAAPYAGGAPAYSQTLARAFLELAAETPHPIAASMIRPAEIVRRIRRLRAGLLAPRLSRSWVVASLVAAVVGVGVLGGLKLVAAGSADEPGAKAKPQPSGSYEKAQKSNGMRAKVGPNTFVLQHVFRMDRNGKLFRNDGIQPGTSSYPWAGPAPLPYKDQAAWLDSATVFFGLDPYDSQAQMRYDVIEVRVFDHKTQQLLSAGDGRWGAGWRMKSPDQVEIFSGGKPLPDTIDLWFRANSYANGDNRVMLQPKAGASFGFAEGTLTIREIRDGQWGYTLKGSQLEWSAPLSDQASGCTVVLDFAGNWVEGQYQVCVMDRKSDRSFADVPHFLDFRKLGSTQVINFPMPLSEVGTVEIRPFGGRHTFYFDGLKLPAVGNPPLVAPPALTFDIGGKEQTLRRELGPLIVDLGSYRGTWEKRSLDLGGANVQDHDAILSLWGQATDSDRCSSFLLRTDGLQVREPSIDVLDRDGLELSPINLRYFRSNVPKVAAVTKVYTFPTTPLAAVEKVVLQLAAGKNDTTTGLPKASAAGAPGATGAGQAAEAAMKDDAVQTTATFSLQFRWVATDAQRGEAVQVPWDDKRQPKANEADLWLLRDVLMTQNDVASAGAYPDTAPGGSTPGSSMVYLNLNAEGSKRFAVLTARGLKRRMAIVRNGRVLTAPTIMSTIPNGALSISPMSKEEADALVASIRAANPAAAEAARTEPVFGPVVEQILHQTGEDCLVDFDLGRLIAAPEGLRGAEKSFQWAAENGVDAGASGGSAPRGLIGMDLILDPRPNDSWDTEIAQNLLNAEVFRVAKAGNPVYMSAEGKLPVTYAFKTREGGIGLVQILEFMDQEPRGTKIRYKMVLRPDATPLPAASDPTTQTTGEGVRLWQEGKLPEAEKKFLEAVAANPKNADAWNGLGWARFNQGAGPTAKEAFEKCVALDPKQAAALNGLGWIAKGDGKTDEAIARWKQAIEAMPNATAALSGLATTYMEKEQYELAAGIYEKWLQAEPNNAQVKADLEQAKSHKPVVALDDLPHLIQELSNPSAPRFEALGRIVQLGSPAVPALIEEMKTNGNWQVPKALGAIGDKRAVEPLIEKLEKNPRWSPMREVVGEALTLLTGQKLEPDAKAWREWWNKNGKSATPKEPADGTKPVAAGANTPTTQTAAASLQFRWVANDAQRDQAEQLPWYKGLRPSGEKSDLWVLKEALLGNQDFTSFWVRNDGEGRFSIEGRLTGSAGKRFAQSTGDNVGQRLAGVVDGHVLSAPVIQSRLGSESLPFGYRQFSVGEAQAMVRALGGTGATPYSADAYQVTAQLEFGPSTPEATRRLYSGVTLYKAKPLGRGETEDPNGPAQWADSPIGDNGQLVFHARLQGEYRLILRRDKPQQELPRLSLPQTVQLDNLAADQALGKVVVPAMGMVSVERTLADPAGPQPNELFSQGEKRFGHDLPALPLAKLHGDQRKQEIGPFLQGEYEAVFAAPGFETTPLTQPVTVLPGKTVPLHIVLRADGQFSGSIYRKDDRTPVTPREVTLQGPDGLPRKLTSSSPVDLTAYQDAVYENFFGFVHLAQGNYELTIEADGYQTYRGTYPVVPGIASKELEILLEPVGAK